MVPGGFSLSFSNLAWPPFSQGFLVLPSAPGGWFPELRQLSKLPGKDRGEQVRKHQESRTKKGGGWTWLRTGLSSEREKNLQGYGAGEETVIREFTAQRQDGSA